MTIVEPVARVLNDYKAAVYAKDVESLLNLYREDVTVFDAWNTWAYEGLEAWRGVVQDWFSSLGKERVVVDFSGVRTTSVGTVAVAHAFVRYQAVAPDGAIVRSMHGRLTLWLECRDDTWKIVHEHTSSPVDPDTSKVILDR